MLVKVCGITTKKDIESLAGESIDMIGLNFYQKSSRYCAQSTPPSFLEVLPPKVSRVGVFVQPSMEELEEYTQQYKLDYLQLHGGESVDFCLRASELAAVIKVFSVTDNFDFATTKAFEFARYLLFDTATPQFGGSGRKFRWDTLKNYNGNTPFLLSGGIGPNDSAPIRELAHPMFAGIDINSKFEILPGVKDIEQVREFVEEVKDSQ